MKNKDGTKAKHHIREISLAAVYCGRPINSSLPVVSDSEMKMMAKEDLCSACVRIYERRQMTLKAGFR